VIVRMAEDGQVPGVDQVVNDPVEFAMAVAKAGPDPEVALEASYGWYWAADLLQANGAKVHLVHPLGLHWDSRRVKTTCGTRPSWRTGCAAGICPRRSFVDEGLELLTEDQARGLLATGEVGRVGVTIGALPAIFRVSCRLIDGSIVFRTAPGSKMSAAAEGAVVAFEVDDYQLADRSGWSVLAVGRAEVVDDLATSLKVLDARVEPLAEGRRTTIVRIEPTFVSGRRIVHDPHPSGT
jgi:nitroimidazol reductase NimA-like FMN-containing flavoprotein (pyridoxamine 5'-phosphate oxidase superfamily)